MNNGIYTQPVTVRRWSLTTPSTFKKLLHRFTFGMFGEPATVQLEEFNTTLFFCGYSEPTPAWSHDVAPIKHYNCRCTVLNVEREV